MTHPDASAPARVVITGADGFIGRHLKLRFRALGPSGTRVIGIGRHQYQDDDELGSAIEQADAVIHCAGINRGPEEAVESGNPDIADRLVAALERCARTPALVYLSSTQRDLDNPYGRGKRRAHDIFAAWHARARSPAGYTELVIPHVFGEGGKPDYNSAVATFCDRLASGRALEVNPDGELELCHVQDVARAAIDALDVGGARQVRLEGVPITVPAVAERLCNMCARYSEDLIPDLSETLNLQLFNTLRYALFPSFYPRTLEIKTDHRGLLFEAIKSGSGGQTFLSRTKPGITRGEHFHLHKVERFLVIEGNATIRLRSLLDDSSQSFEVSGESPAYVDMPTCHTHNIENTGDGPLTTVFWSNEIFDPSNPDTYAEPVERG